MAINTGVNTSKLVGYSVLSVPVGVNTSKLVGYCVLGQPNVTAPVWPSFTFAGGVVGVPYSQSWDLTPASPPTTYSVVSGSLPGGLSVSSTGGTTDVGTLSGTPTAAGTFNFTLRATNAYGSANQPFTLTIISGGGNQPQLYISVS